MIDVRYPHVEGNDAELEADSGDQEDDAEAENGLVGLAAEQALGDRRDFERSGRAVDHRHTVEQQARSQRAKHEIFHRRFGRHHRVAVECDHRVERQRQEFDADVDGQEMIGRNHHHHSQRREQRQRVELALGHVGSRLNVGSGVEQHDDHRDVEQLLEQIAHQVADEHIAEGVEDLPGTRQPGGHRRTDQRQLGQHEGRGTLLVLDEQIDDHDQTGHRQQEDFRNGKAEIRRYKLHFGKRHSGYQL